MTLASPEIVPVFDREINPRMNPNAKVDPNFTVKADPTRCYRCKRRLRRHARCLWDPIFNFNGQGYTFVNPPDTVGDVGANHYVQMINATGAAVYNKATAR